MITKGHHVRKGAVLPLTTERRLAMSLVRLYGQRIIDQPALIARTDWQHRWALERGQLPTPSLPRAWFTACQLRAVLFPENA